MKKLKKVRLFMVLSIICCSFYGCGLDLIGSAVITGVEAYQMKKDMASMDLSGKIMGDINQMETVVAQVFQEMGIEVVQPQKDEKPMENYIRGKTNKHEIIEVVWEPVTQQIFSVGVKARYPGIGFFETNKDIEFSTTIITLIDAKYRAGIKTIAPKKNPKKSAAPPVPAIAKMLKTTKEGLIRAGPGAEFKVIAVVKSGSILFNLGKQNSWNKVQTEAGEVGFIYYTVVKPADI